MASSFPLPWALAVLAFAALAILGGLAAYRLACRREDDPRRPRVLLYHRVIDRSDWEVIQPISEKVYAVPRDRFEAQMAFLAEHGYRPISAERLVAFLRDGADLPERSVVISFDDGCESVVRNALPVLARHGFPAVLFVTTDPDAVVFHQGSHPERKLTDAELLELDRGGVTIGSHSVTHRPLETLTPAELRHELGASRAALEAVLGKPVRYFGVPFGFYGRRAREAARAAGYEAVFTSTNGSVPVRSDPFHIRRFSVSGRLDVDGFARALTGRSLVRRRLGTSLKRLPARVVGPRLWMPVRRRLLDLAGRGGRRAAA